MRVYEFTQALRLGMAAIRTCLYDAAPSIEQRAEICGVASKFQDFKWSVALVIWPTLCLAGGEDFCQTFIAAPFFRSHGGHGGHGATEPQPIPPLKLYPERE